MPEGSSGTFTEAFVEEVIIDVNEEDLQAREGDSENLDPTKILLAPHNSLIVRMFSNQQQQDIAYPFFPPYFLMPVKVGDHVWTVKLGSTLYWICRKTQNSDVDDLSQTWAERSAGQGAGDNDTSKQTDRAQSGTNIVPRVHPVMGEVFTTDPDSAGTQEDGTEVILFTDLITEKRKYISEVVPRFKKRPGDLVLQGSNNAIISLGSDRGFKKEDTIDPTTPSSAADTPVAGSGTIDLVTGRGRYIPKTVTDDSTLGDKPLRTAPPVITNAYGEIEVDKDPIANELGDVANRSEGDPDFGFDASRIYISSNTKVDENFSLIESYPPIPAVIKADTGSVPDPVEAAAIALKSDEIRIIARKHIAADHFADADSATADASDVNGSIKIVKEGTRDGSGHATTDGEGAAVIMIQPDGTIMVDGPTIVIGTGRETSNGAGDQVFIGAGASEPMVLGTVLKSLLDTFFDDLTSFLETKYDTHIHPTGVGPSGPPTVVGNDAGAGTAKGTTESFLSKVGKLK